MAQNAGRIIRALLEIGISRKWANVTAVLMSMSKAIEKKLWPFDHPLKQSDLKPEVLYGLQTHADELTVSELASMSASELGRLVHLNEHHGAAIRKSAKQFPTVEMSYKLRPLGGDILKIVVQISRGFDWNAKIHGSVEPFWLWVEDQEGLTILHMSHLTFRPTSNFVQNDFVISIPDGQPPAQVIVRFSSDRWLGADDELTIPMESLPMPLPSTSHSPLLDVPLLSLDVLGNRSLEDFFAKRFLDLNGIQTQTIWTLIHTNLHTLICAPTGSGKSTLAQILIWFGPPSVP